MGQCDSCPYRWLVGSSSLGNVLILNNEPDNEARTKSDSTKKSFSCSLICLLFCSPQNLLQFLYYFCFTPVQPTSCYFPEQSNWPLRCIHLLKTVKKRGRLQQSSPLDIFSAKQIEKIICF